MLCTCMFSKFEVNPKVIFRSPYFYQMANSKCRSDRNFFPAYISFASNVKF